MARPTWVTVVGILGIIFGLTGILGGGQQMMLPKILEMQKAVFADVGANMQRTRNGSRCQNGNSASTSDSSSSATSVASVTPCQAAPFSGAPFPDIFKTMFDFPPWFASWIEVSGALRCLVAAFYLFSAIWFIQLKPSSIWLFSAALSLSILVGVAQLIGVLYAESVFLIAMMAGSGVGMVIDAVLLVVIWMSDRSVFKASATVVDPSRAAL